ncbi:MAG: hypothetical protein K8W52_10180 [Deltaproteobacteria bacterium]|nr:hypothetical protein [Deltaproteobacteria bacterium]
MIAIGACGLVAGSARAGDAGVASAPTARPLISLPGSSQIMLPRPAKLTSVPVPIVVLPGSGVDPDTLDAEVLAIVRDGSVQASASTAVSAAIDLTTSGTVLSLTVALDQLFVPGSYDVTIAVYERAPGASSIAGDAGVPGGADAGAPIAIAPEAPQILVVRLVLPAATLRPVPAIVIDREVPWPFSDHATVEPNTVALFENGNASAVRIAADREGGLTANEHQVGAEVTAVVDGWIEPGRVGRAALTLSGDFPMGTTRGTLLVTARELVAPIAIPFEVHNHRPAWWVLVLFAAGAGAGYGWRTVLVRRRANLADDLAAGEVRERVDAMLATLPPSWQAEFDDLRSKREAITAKEGASRIAADTALVAAITLRDAKVRELRSAIEAARVATRTPWRLPLGLGLVDAASAYDAANERATARDLPGAVAASERGRSAIAAVVGRGREWCDTLLASLRSVDEALGCTPAAGRSAIEGALADLRTTLAGVAAVTQPTTTASAVAQLQALHDGLRAADSLAQAFEDALAHALPTTLDAAAASRLRGAISLAPRVLGRPDFAIIDAAQACIRLKGEAAAVLRDQNEGTVPPPAVAALAAGDYVAALGAPPAFRRSNDALGQPVAARVMTLTTIDDRALRVRAHEVPPQAPAQVPIAEVAFPSFRSTGALHAAIGHVDFMRFLVAMLVTSFAAFALYGDSFIGGAAECFGVFAFGFVTDLTTDTAITSLLGKVKGPGGGTIATGAAPTGTT